MANPTVINFLDLVGQQVASFLKGGTKVNRPVCTSCDEGPSACIYIDPVMRGRDNYGDRVAMRITAKRSLPDQKDGHSVLEEATFEVHYGRPVHATHFRVVNPREAIQEFLRYWTFVALMEDIQSPASAESVSVTVCLNSPIGPVAVLVGNSNDGTLAENKEALLQARVSRCLNQ